MLRNGLEPGHLLVLVIVFIMLFGAKRLPDTARGLGRALRILKAETQGRHDDEDPPASSPATTPPPREQS